MTPDQQAEVRASVDALLAGEATALDHIEALIKCFALSRRHVVRRIASPNPAAIIQQMLVDENTGLSADELFSISGACKICALAKVARDARRPYASYSDAERAAQKQASDAYYGDLVRRMSVH